MNRVENCHVSWHRRALCSYKSTATSSFTGILQMFNCLPGAMLEKGHTHQWKKGFSCSRVPSQHNARMTASHRLFNPGSPGGKARTGLGDRLSRGRAVKRVHTVVQTARNLLQRPPSKLASHSMNARVRRSVRHFRVVATV